MNHIPDLGWIVIGVVGSLLMGLALVACWVSQAVPDPEGVAATVPEEK